VVVSISDENAPIAIKRETDGSEKLGVLGVTVTVPSAQISSDFCARPPLGRPNQPNAVVVGVCNHHIAHSVNADAARVPELGGAPRTVLKMTAHIINKPWSVANHLRD
jgi:hypothetical protein